MQETRMGYCPFSFCAGPRYKKLYHDTGVQGCIKGGHDTASNLMTRPCDTARMPCDTASLRVQRVAASARGAWSLGCVAIQSFVSGREGGLVS